MAQLPLMVIAYVGDWMPESQPHWGDETYSLAEARRMADATWRWWNNKKADRSPQEIDTFCVGVWRQDHTGGIDFPTPLNALYFRGRWVEESTP